MAFSRWTLRHDPWWKQVEILRAIKTERSIGVKASHATGKTWLAGDAALWWLSAFKDGVVLTTAPTWTQIQRVLWGEIRAAIEDANTYHPGLFPVPTKEGLTLGPKNYALPISTNEGVRFQGFHGRILIILDEANGVKPYIWEAIEGIRASGDVCQLALANPFEAIGPFYDAFTRERSRWRTFTLSALESPNLQGLTVESLKQLSEEELDQNVRPYLVTRRWVKEKLSDWGVDHPLFQARVLGEFPKQSDRALCPLTWLDAARVREIDIPEGSELQAGIDVAGPGDDETALVIREGPRIIYHDAWPQPDPRGPLVAALQPYKARGIRIVNDVVGIGYYLGLHLRDLGFRVYDFNAGERAQDAERFANRKAEAHWGFRDRLEAGDISGLTDDVAIGQLATIPYGHNARGQVVIESKDNLRKLGLKSPDRGEATVSAYYDLRKLKGGPVNINAEIR